MRVADMMHPEGRVFLKSEYGPVDAHWPAVSFSKPGPIQELTETFVPGRDILICVGTSGADTPNAVHRSSLLSAVVFEPSRLLETRRIVPSESWDRYAGKAGTRWQHSFAVIEAATFVDPPFPRARSIVPQAYASLSRTARPNGVPQATGAERDAVMALPTESIDFGLGPAVSAQLMSSANGGADVPPAVGAQVLRMARLLVHRARRSGQSEVRIAPSRSAPSMADACAMLLRSWYRERSGACALCGTPIPADTPNRMLQPSVDRVDSANGSYDEVNVQVTHLACNLAKNVYGTEHFSQWLEMLRDAGGMAERRQ